MFNINHNTTADYVATHQKTQQGLKLECLRIRHLLDLCRNASENPAGIETSG